MVSGGFGSGKTLFCQKMAAEVRAAGLAVNGLLSPGRFEEGQKTGFWCEDLQSGERRFLASSKPDEIAGFELGIWTFDPLVVDWGNQILQSIQSTDVLIVDELGPLEFNLQLGWQSAFSALQQLQYRLALVVIRPDCLDAFKERGFDFKLMNWQQSSTLASLVREL